MQSINKRSFFLSFFFPGPSTKGLRAKLLGSESKTCQHGNRTLFGPPPLLLPPGSVRCVNFKHRIHVIGNWVNPEVATFCCCCQRSRVLLLTATTGSRLQATAYRVHLPRCPKFVIPKDPSSVYGPHHLNFGPSGRG